MQLRGRWRNVVSQGLLNTNFSTTVVKLYFKLSFGTTSSLIKQTKIIIKIK